MKFFMVFLSYCHDLIKIVMFKSTVLMVFL